MLIVPLQLFDARTAWNNLNTTCTFFCYMFCYIDFTSLWFFRSALIPCHVMPCLPFWFHSVVRWFITIKIVFSLSHVSFMKFDDNSFDWMCVYWLCKIFEIVGVFYVSFRLFLGCIDLLFNALLIWDLFLHLLVYTRYPTSHVKWMNATWTA